jgi:RNA polymerase sigma factor (sigma-70 family)
MTDLARRLRYLAAGGTDTDADLLARFAADRDGLAFAALVARHGPMVLAVCRRVLRHRQDAEDAFQAAFLVLARRAAGLAPAVPLGGWLHGVAYRTALAARRVRAARRAREAKAARVGEVGPEEAGLSTELREALDRELAALPEVYRAALVACELEGLTRREAALRLGWAEGTLSSRLARARELLARRLRRCGLVAPAAGLGAVAAPAAVAGELAEPTVRLATLVAAGEAAVAAPVAALMEGAMGTILVTKFKTLAATAVVGCAVLVTATAGWRANAAGGGNPPRVAEPPKATEAPKRAAKSDKEQIAELERERAALLSLVADLRDRLAKVEAERADTKSVPMLGLVADPFAPKPEAAPARNRGQTAADPVPKAPAGVPNMPAPVRPVTSSALPAGQPGNHLATPGVTADRPAAGKAVVRVYPVAELAPDAQEGEALAKVVRATVEPGSWGVDAGVEYLPGRKVLVVRQTARGHDEVAELLQALQVQGAPPKKAGSSPALRP